MGKNVAVVFVRITKGKVMEKKKCHYCCVCKNYKRKGDGGWGKKCRHCCVSKNYKGKGDRKIQTKLMEDRKKIHYCCVGENFRKKLIEDEKGCFCFFFPADQKIASAWKGGGGGGYLFGRWGGDGGSWGWGGAGGHPIQHEQQVLACCQTHSDYGPSKIPLKLAL